MAAPYSEEGAKATYVIGARHIPAEALHPPASVASGRLILGAASTRIPVDSANSAAGVAVGNFLWAPMR